MRKKRRKFAGLIGILLALALCLTAASPILAAETGHTVTIHSAAPGHTYEAYRILGGHISGGVLVDITWGDGVIRSGEGGTETSPLLEALQNNPTLGSHFKDCSSAADVAEKLSDKKGSFMDNSVLLDAFSDVVSKYLSDTKRVSGAPSGSVSAGYIYTIAGLEDGYYFIREAAMSSGAEGSAYSKFMLKVADGDIRINAKEDAPELDKKIDGDLDTDPGTDGDVTVNQAAVGDTVPFKIVSGVPAMDGYEKYYFMVEDTLSGGLTFDKTSVTVRVGETELKEGQGYAVETEPEHASAGQEQTVRIILKNFIQYKGQTEAPIAISYSATVNEEAQIGTAGNRNEAKLFFSNDPNVSGGQGAPGNSDKPGPDSPVGKTPPSETRTYVTGLELLKVDPKGASLSGAKFLLEGRGLNRVLVSGAGVIKADDGKVEGTVDENGVLRFDGLAAGEYTITELRAPDGYRRLEEPIKISVAWTPPRVPSTECSWSVTGNDDGENAVVKEGVIELSIVNESGLLLPAVGGSGTAAFYVLGGLLAAAGGATCFVIVRKRGEKK